MYFLYRNYNIFNYCDSEMLEHTTYGKDRGLCHAVYVTLNLWINQKSVVGLESLNVKFRCQLKDEAKTLIFV